jgi:hypothetical protein
LIKIIKIKTQIHVLDWHTEWKLKLSIDTEEKKLTDESFGKYTSP